MDNREFARAYARRGVEGRREPTAEYDGFMEGARRWSGFFSDTLSDFLNDKPMPTTIDFATNEMGQYYFWSRTYRAKAVSQAIELGISDPDDHFRTLNELSFHIMSEAMTFTWAALVGSERFKIENGIHRDIQTFLAMEAADIARQRKHYMELEEQTGERSGIVGAFNGILTEIDTAITLEELAKEDKEGVLAVLAAPKDYESSQNGTRNADLLVIDRKLKQIRGIQSKTRIGSTEESASAIRRHYDPTYVTMIDGFHDLGNTAPGNYRPGKGRLTVAQPGLIAMDHLQSLSVKALPMRGFAGDAMQDAMQKAFRMELMRAKSIARELSGGRKSFIPFAVDNIREKVLHDLYMESPTEAVQAS